MKKGGTRELEIVEEGKVRDRTAVESFAIKIFSKKKRM